MEAESINQSKLGSTRIFAVSLMWVFQPVFRLCTYGAEPVHLTDPEDEVILNGVLSFTARGAQGAAGPFGALLLLPGGLSSSLGPLRGACGWGGVGY